MRVLRRAVKIFLSVLACLICLGVLAVTIFGVQGYLMSREALEKLPAEEMAAEIRSMEHFTAIDELPEFYVKAVVAAEVIGVPKMAVGSRLYESKIYLETDSLLAWTLTIVLLSVALEALLRRLARRVLEVRHE